MFRMRRRPLLGGLLVGGAAYSMGKHGAQAKAQEQSQNEQIAQLQQEQAAQTAPPPPPAPAAPAATDADPMAKLNQLAQLRRQGMLTDEEFTAAKAKIIGI